MNKQLKVIYGMFLIVLFILWVSSIFILRAQIGVSVTIYFVQLLGCMFIFCVFDYINKFKKKNEKVEDFSVIIPAVGIASCFFYLAYLGF